MDGMGFISLNRQAKYVPRRSARTRVAGRVLREDLKEERVPAGCCQGRRKSHTLRSSRRWVSCAIAAFRSTFALSAAPTFPVGSRRAYLASKRASP